MKFKYTILLAIFAFVNIGITFLVSDKIYSQKIKIIPENTTYESSIEREESDIILSENSNLVGDIKVEKGNIYIGKNSKVSGDVISLDGNIILEEFSRIDGDVKASKGKVIMKSNVKVTGKLFSYKIGEWHSSSSVKGKITGLLETSDYPPALAYFEILPNRHKAPLGYVFITKNDPTLIRKGAKKEDYFYGVYKYDNGKLVEIDLSKNGNLDKFYLHAKKFYSRLAERRLKYYKYGGATRKYAFDRRKGDIFVPYENSKYVFVHEMAHIIDFEYGFSDFYNPKYPFLSKKNALNSYGATHPGEDFAEGYKYYVLNKSHFRSLIGDNEERQAKYDYFKNIVFGE